MASIPASVSWSVRAITVKPASAWAFTTSAAGSSPSLKIVCRCRFARPLDTSANGRPFYVVSDGEPGQPSCYNRGRVLMSSDRQPPLSLVRRLVAANLARPIPELIDQALTCLVQALDARAAFYARIDDHSFEIIATHVQSGAPIERGLRMALEDTFAAVDEEMEGGVLNIRDASKRQPFKSLAMRQRLGITSYLGTSFPAQGEVTGTLGVLGKGPRTFDEMDQDLLLIVAGLLAPRLQPEPRSGNGQSRTPVSVVRLASEEDKEPLAILRGYADMLSNGEVPADQMPMVAQRLALQSETLIRVADQVLLLSRLLIELAISVRVSLGAIAQAAGQRIRDRMSRAGM